LNSNIEVVDNDVKLVSDYTSEASSCYFWNNLFFLGAAIIYFIQGPDD